MSDSTNAPATATPAVLFAPQPPAMLALADGTLFRGISIGAEGTTTGEVVFNTSMTGYQEILTDPSYAGQIVTLTYPHIGNVGINADDVESRQVFAAGLVIRDLPRRMSNFRATMDLSAYLRASNIVAIAGIDTRKLTRILRENGAQNGAIIAATSIGEVVELALLARARSAPSMAGLDLARDVTASLGYDWTAGTWAAGLGYHRPDQSKLHVVAFDFGVKHNILRMLAERGCRITVVPATTSARQVMDLHPDGVFLSNGPGDPEPCDYAIDAIRAIVESDTPTFGICLGHQLLALASGGRTMKMKFGHHGANHPVLDRDTGQVMITSQNHGFAVDPQSLPQNLRVTHVSLFDGTLQGMQRTDRRAFSFQGHPEASPGPHDIGYLFDRFVEVMGGGSK